MIGHDCKSISRCWDLKGSLHQRKTKVPENDTESLDEGDQDGFTVLKDLNLLEKSGKAYLSHVSKLDMIERIKKDTAILRE